VTAAGHSLRLRYGVTAPPSSGVRVFSGAASGDTVRMLPGATQGITSGGGITLAMIVKRTGTSAGAIMTAANNANGGTYSCHVQLAVKAAANGNYLYASVNSGIVVDSVSTVPWTTADGWCLVAATKIPGPTPSRLHKIPLGGTPVHGNGATNQDNGQTLASTARWEFGRGEYGDWVTDKIAVAGVWNTALTDAQIEQLAANLRTSDWWSVSGDIPLALWEFNQTLVATPIVDLMSRGADETYRNNTTIDGADPPSTWLFDGGPTNVIADTDLGFYYSGGASNSNRALSVGGTISTVPVTSGATNNLWDDLTANECAAGETEYHCVYLANNHPTLNWYGVTASIDDPSDQGADAIAVDSAPAGSPAASSSATPNTAPSPTVTFGSSVVIGDIPPGSYRALWQRRTISPGALNGSDRIGIVCQGTSTMIPAERGGPKIKVTASETITTTSTVAKAAPNPIRLRPNEGVTVSAIVTSLRFSPAMIRPTSAITTTDALSALGRNPSMVRVSDTVTTTAGTATVFAGPGPLTPPVIS
jgi:hypothetical protein